MTTSLARPLAGIEGGAIYPLTYRRQCEKGQELLELPYDLDRLGAV